MYLTQVAVLAASGGDRLSEGLAGVSRPFRSAAVCRGYLILHLGNPTVRISAAFPVFIGHFLVLPAAIQPAQIFLGRFFDAFGFGQALQVFLPILTRVLAHNAFHRRVGLQGGGVNSHVLPAQEPFLLLQRLKLELPPQPPPRITRPNLFGETGSVVKT
jgi:hypothetical protein